MKKILIPLYILISLFILLSCSNSRTIDDENTRELSKLLSEESNNINEIYYYYEFGDLNIDVIYTRGTSDEDLYQKEFPMLESKVKENINLELLEKIKKDNKLGFNDVNINVFIGSRYTERYYQMHACYNMNHADTFNEDKDSIDEYKTWTVTREIRD